MYDNLTDLAMDSDAIVKVHVVTPGVVIQDPSANAPLTVTPLLVVATFKGAASGSTVHVVERGGVLNGLEYVDATVPPYEMGKTYYLFLRATQPGEGLDGMYTLTGGPQGRFPMQSGLVYSMDHETEANSWLPIKLDGLSEAAFQARFLEEVGA